VTGLREEVPRAVQSAVVLEGWIFVLHRADGRLALPHACGPPRSARFVQLTRWGVVLGALATHSLLSVSGG
jgi:hypothetical protein